MLSNSANTIQVGHKAVILKDSAADVVDMKAAARTVGSLVAHKSLRKPHHTVSVNLNGSCGKTDNPVTPPKRFSMALPNGTTTGNRGVHDGEVHEAQSVRQLNGLDTHPTNGVDTPSFGQHTPQHHSSNSLGQHGITTSPQQPSTTSQQHNSPRVPTPEQHFSSHRIEGHLLKTEGQHSNDHSSLTDLSNKGRLMCPELAISYAGTLIKKRTGCLGSKQRDLEQKVASLQRKIRLRQLHMVHSHACRQLVLEGSIDDQDSSNMEEGSCSSLTDSDFSMGISPPPSEKQRTELRALPLQVDGASDDAFLPPVPEVAMLEEDEEGHTGGPGRKRAEDSFSSMDSHASSICPSEGEEDSGAVLATQLASLESQLDEDLTEASSDEEGEGEESADLHHKYVIGPYLAPVLL